MPALVASLLAQSRPPDQIHLIDNGSRNPAKKALANYLESVNIVESDQCLGFGGACNVGIQQAVDNHADYILVLNQDLELERQACEIAVAILNTRPELGLLGLSQLDYSGTSLDPPFRNCLPKRMIDDAFLGTLDDFYEAEFVPAAAVLIRTATVEQVGGFDPLYFMYHEDVDLCQRVRRAELQVGIATRARVRHDCGQTRATRDHVWYRNWFHSRAVHHLKWSSRPLWLAFLTLFKKILPRWKMNEAWYWFRSAASCCSRWPEFRRRRLPDDGLKIAGANTPQRVAVPANEHPSP